MKFNSSNKFILLFNNFIYKSLTSLMIAILIIFTSILIYHKQALAKNILAEIFKAYSKYQEINMMLWLAGDTKAEKRFGEEVRWFLNLTNKKVKNPETIRWVNTVFERVKAQFKNIGFDYTITVYEGNTINAFAIPGGHIFIYKGMLDFVSSDDELAAVLAHELAHVEKRHALRHFRQNVAFQIILEKAVKNKRDKETWGQLVGALLMLQFTREDEFEADQIGIERMAKAGYNPQAQVVLWEKFVEKFGKGEKGLLKYLSTHPPSIERVEFAKKNLNKILAQQKATQQHQSSIPIPYTTNTNNTQPIKLPIVSTQANISTDSTNIANQQTQNTSQTSQQQPSPSNSNLSSMTLSYNPLEDLTTNLIQNHSFETDLDLDNFPDSWQIKEGKAQINYNQNVTGKKSLELISEVAFVPTRVISDFIQINPKQSYSFQCYVKIQNINQKPNIGFECYNNKKQLIGYLWPLSEISITPNSWHKIQAIVNVKSSTSIPNSSISAVSKFPTSNQISNYHTSQKNNFYVNTKYVRLIIQNGPSTHKGSIYFDDILLEPYPNTTRPNIIDNGDFEYAFINPNLPDGVRGSINNLQIDKTFFKTGYASLCAFAYDKPQEIEIYFDSIPISKFQNQNNVNISFRYSSSNPIKFKLTVIGLDHSDKILTPYILQKEIASKPKIWLDSKFTFNLSNYVNKNMLDKVIIKFTSTLEPNTKLWLDSLVLK